MGGSRPSTALPTPVPGAVHDADASTSAGRFPEAGKPRLAVASPGSSVAWTAASPVVAAPDFDPDFAGDYVRFGVRLRALVLGECLSPVARIRALGIPRSGLTTRAPHSAIRCACTTERLLVSARDRNSQITGRPGATSPKLPAPAHLRTPLPQNPPTRRVHPPALGTSARVLRRDRLGGLIHEYAQVA